MAVTKKTVEEIAKENAIDISKENAQKVADAYIKPTLNEINVAEQQAIADTQAARKALENDYFNQYRANTYEAQSRGLTGGLAQIDNQLLRMQMGQANADLSKNLLLSQNKASAQRGTALANAEAYKTEYLNNMLEKVSALREQDYAQRYAEWQYAQQMAQAEKEFAEQQRQWNLNYQLSRDRYNLEREQWQKNYELQKAQYDRQNKLEDIQYAAYVDEYLDNQLPDVANTYMNYLNSGNYQKAGEYLGKTASQLSNKYGVNSKEIINQIGTIEQYNRAKATMEDTNLQSALAQSRTKQNAQNLIGSLATGLGIGLAPFTGGITLAALPMAGYSFYQAGKEKNNYQQYQQLLQNATNKTQSLQNSLPSWYLQ